MCSRRMVLSGRKGRPSSCRGAPRAPREGERPPDEVAHEGRDDTSGRQISIAAAATKSRTRERLRRRLRSWPSMSDPRRAQSRARPYRAACDVVMVRRASVAGTSGTGRSAAKLRGRSYRADFEQGPAHSSTPIVSTTRPIARRSTRSRIASAKCSSGSASRRAAGDAGLGEDMSAACSRSRSGPSRVRFPRRGLR